MTPVARNGRLSIKGASLLNESGKEIQLRGMSSHGLMWFPQLYNKDTLKWLRDDWNIDIFRLAMYTGEGGYLSNPGIKGKVHEMVRAAIDLGVYVIIDWHILSDNNPLSHTGEAKRFFDEMASTYASAPNVFYEICNEPNGWGVNWQSAIRPYAEQVIPVIRAKDPKGIILVGTGSWSQDVHEVMANPLHGENIMYVVHFYAGTHGQWLKDRISTVRSKGLAVFVTEWGVSQASGSGGVYWGETRSWLDFMRNNKISWANWSLATKDETSAALRPWANPHGGWDMGVLSESGKLLRGELRSTLKALEE